MHAGEELQELNFQREDARRRAVQSALVCSSPINAQSTEPRQTQVEKNPTLMKEVFTLIKKHCIQKLEMHHLQFLCYQ